MLRGCHCYGFTEFEGNLSGRNFPSFSQSQYRFFPDIQNSFTQKGLSGPLRYCDFWTQRIEIYKIGMFLCRSVVSVNVHTNVNMNMMQIYGRAVDGIFDGTKLFGPPEWRLLPPN